MILTGRRSESQLEDGFNIPSLKIFTNHLLSEKPEMPTGSYQRLCCLGLYCLGLRCLSLHCLTLLSVLILQQPLAVFNSFIGRVCLTNKNVRLKNGFRKCHNYGSGL